MLKDIVGERGPDPPKKLLAVVDRGLYEHHPGLLGDLEAYCRTYDGHCQLAEAPLVVPGGEEIKNDPGALTRLHRAVNAAGLCRHSYIMAVGGGAVIDLVGLAAATAHRGIKLIRVPTTVMAQADASIGVKNGIWGTTIPLKKRKCFTAGYGRETPGPGCTAPETIEHGKVFLKEVSFPSVGGSPSRFQVATLPLRNAQGRVIGVMEYFRDITEGRRAEAEAAGAALQNRPTGHRTTPGPIPRGLVHDFNNALNTLLGYTEMALLSLSDSREVGEAWFFLEEVFDAEELAQDLIRQIDPPPKPKAQPLGITPLSSHMVPKRGLEPRQAYAH